MTKQTDFNMGRIIELADALTHERQSVFDRSIGVDENCLSPRKIIKVLMGGATNEDRAHLLACSTCLENVTHSAAVNLESGPHFVAQSLKKATGIQPQKVLFAQVKKERPLPAIIGLESHIFHITDPVAKDLTLTCDLVPAFDPELLRKLNVESLHVDGAIITKREPIVNWVDSNNDGKTDFLRITFKDARLARRVRDGIAHRQRVIDTIYLHGRFKDERREGFVGQASIEFLLP